MNSVQENKNELEAAVRYCESAISRAKATIESMEFRQQAALNDRLMIATKEVEELKSEVAELEQSEQDLKQANMGLVCDNDDLKDEIAELSVKQQKMEQTIQLQKEQIAMFQRKMSRLNEVDR
jgi:chromosome segregation ATPase